MWTIWLYHRVLSPKDADGMANSVVPDQTAPLGAVWSGSTLFAQAYLSKNLGSLRIPRAFTAENIAFPYQPHHEKTCFSQQHANNKSADQPAHPRSLISTFVVCCLDSIIPLVSRSEISSLYIAYVQAGLSLTWSKTPKTGFLLTRLIPCLVYRTPYCRIPQSTFSYWRSAHPVDHWGWNVLWPRTFLLLHTRSVPHPSRSLGHAKTEIFWNIASISFGRKPFRLDVWSNMRY